MGMSSGERFLLMLLCVVSATGASAGALTAKIAERYGIVQTDTWYGGERTRFDFEGCDAWVVEPPTGVAPVPDRLWTWTMQWRNSFVERTRVPELLARGWHHVGIDTFAHRMDDEGVALSRRFQKYLVDELKLSPNAALIGMSWGGFFSVRYAAAHPDCVDRIYLDCPLLNFAAFKMDIGPWRETAPADGDWTKDPRMPVNLAPQIAAARIPVLIAYGGQDKTVPPDLNSRLFVSRMKKAGGEIRDIYRSYYGHHPHGLEMNEPDLVNFLLGTGRRVRLDFATDADWTLENYQNRLRIDRAATEDGRACLAVRGPVERKDTAWKIVSRKIPVSADAGEFVLSVDVKGRRFIQDHARAKPRPWENRIAWFGADGKLVAEGPIPHLMTSGHDEFRTVCEWGRIPSGSASCEIRFGFDAPDLHPDKAEDPAREAYFLSDVRFDTLPKGCSRAGEFALRDRHSRWACDYFYGGDPSVKRVSPAKRGATIRKDGVLLVDGEPFFPIGMCGVRKRECNGDSYDKAFADLKAAGFNLVSTFRNWRDPDYLAAAKKYDMKLTVRPTDIGWREVQRIRKEFVALAAEVPQIFAWEIGDDTANWVPPQAMREMDAALKSLSPQCLTCQADTLLLSPRAPVSQYAPFVRYSDIFEPEVYPMYRAHNDLVGSNAVAFAIRDMERICADQRDFGDGRPRACWPIVQYFGGWDGFAFPSRDQLFGMVWACIIHGAKGVTFYTYGGHGENQGVTSTPERWAAICALAGEVRDYSPVLVDASPDEHPSVEIVSGPQKDGYGKLPSVTCLRKRHAGKTYLFTVNAANAPVTAKLAAPDPRTVAYRPFEVKIFNW